MTHSLTLRSKNVRDDASTTSSSDTSLQQLPPRGQSSSSSLHTVICKAISALIPRRSGLNPKESSNDENDYESSEKKTSSSLSPGPWSENTNLESGNIKVFNYKELKIATRNFHSGVVLGECGLGILFKGWINTNTLTATKPGKGIVVAIKSLYSESMEDYEWSAEVNFLGWLSHPNLVKLYGYCLANEKRLLVYEFMPRGCLDSHLFRRGSPCLLSWSLRMKIALGAAKGLAFLHRPDVNIIHQGVQSSNVLLDSDYNAKLSGFWLARNGPTGSMSHVTTTRIMGTYGYLAPEYVATGHLTAKCDIYSFGVVLLETLSGRRTIDTSRSSAEHDLVKWAKPYLSNKNKIFHVLDNNLKGQCTLESADKAANLVLRCLSKDPKSRPNMDEVVSTMEQV